MQATREKEEVLNATALPAAEKTPSRPVSLSLYEQGKTLHEIASELDITDEQAGRKLMRETERYACDMLEQMSYHKTLLGELNEQYRQLTYTLIRMKQTPPA